MKTTKKAVVKKAAVQKVVKKVVKKTAPKETKKEVANEEKFAKLVGQINSKEERGFAFVATLKDDDNISDVAACMNKVKGIEMIRLIATLATMYGLEDGLIEVLVRHKIRG